MITRQELKRVFRLLRKHEELISEAYLSHDGILELTDADPGALEELADARLAWRPGTDEPLRLSRELAKRLNDSLGLISAEQMSTLAGTDPELRRYLQRWLLPEVEACRLQAADAVHKLNALLYEYRRQQHRSRLIESFHRRYQTDPGYLPVDYTAGEIIPAVFNQVGPLDLSAHASLQELPQDQEIALLTLIQGLRLDRPTAQSDTETPAIQVRPPPAPEVFTRSALDAAVDDLFLAAAEIPAGISALTHCPDQAIEPDPELWLYAVLNRYFDMEADDRSLYAIDYVEEIDPVFSGLRRVRDLTVRFRADAMETA